METVDIGKADLFLGESFSYPWFFESPSRKMMVPQSPLVITFKTWKGEFFQFRLGKFHNNGCMILTSTLKDTFFFFWTDPSFSGTMAKAENGGKKKPIKGSYSGYSCWGGYFKDLYNTLMKHLEEQEISFTDDQIKMFYIELKRREKEYVEKHSEPNT